MKTLVYGFGNIGRQDDGLGILCAEHIEAAVIENTDVTVNFQLNAEDALTISNYDRVLFVDASTAIEPPYELERLVADDSIAFSTHAMSPQAILAFCESTYQAKPEAWLLHITGYEWEFGLPLTETAEANLQQALVFVKDWLAN